MIRQGPQQQFFKRINRQTTPLLQINNTPIRIRQTNKENIHEVNNKKNQILQNQPKNLFQNENINQNKTVLKKKISNVVTCSNHPDVMANYCIKIDDEYMNYCQKCSAYLASNGFTIQKLTPSSSGSMYQTKQNRSSYNKRKNQLNTFLSSLQKIEKRYIQKDQHMKKIKTSYQIQKQTINNFYASMLQYIQYIKNQHLTFIDQESDRFQQINDQQIKRIQSTLQEVEAMRQDIENNVDKIIEQVDEESYNQCMGYYNRQRQEHEKCLQDLKSQGNGMTTSIQMVNQKLNGFKVFMQELTGISCNNRQQQQYDYDEESSDRLI